jgi:hypothetical protein
VRAGFQGSSLPPRGGFRCPSGRCAIQRLPLDPLGLAERNISVSLEDAFWNALKEIAATSNVLLSDLVARSTKSVSIQILSSVLRVFVLLSSGRSIGR